LNKLLSVLKGEHTSAGMSTKAPQRKRQQETPLPPSSIQDVEMDNFVDEDLGSTVVREFNAGITAFPGCRETAFNTIIQRAGQTTLSINPFDEDGLVVVTEERQEATPKPIALQSQQQQQGQLLESQLDPKPTPVSSTPTLPQAPKKPKKKRKRDEIDDIFGSL